jgi:ABC-2 type transport system permease protein
MAVSARSSDVRVAQQLSTFASLPPLGLTAMISLNVIHPTFTLAVVFAVGLLAIDVLLLRFVSSLFDPERLVTGMKAVGP